MEEDLHSGPLTHSSTDGLVPTPILSMMSKLLAFIINWWIQNRMNLAAEDSRHLLLSLCSLEVLPQFNSALCLGFTRVKLSCLLDSGSYEFGKRNMFQINLSCWSNWFPCTYNTNNPGHLLALRWESLLGSGGCLSPGSHLQHSYSLKPRSKESRSYILRLKTCVRSPEK